MKLWVITKTENRKVSVEFLAASKASVVAWVKAKLDFDVKVGTLQFHEYRNDTQIWTWGPWGLNELIEHLYMRPMIYDQNWKTILHDFIIARVQDCSEKQDTLQKKIERFDPGREPLIRGDIRSRDHYAREAKRLNQIASWIK